MSGGNLCATPGAIRAALAGMGLAALMGTAVLGDSTMEMMPPHPGQIKMVEEHDGSVRMLDASTVPDRQRFVYLDVNGIEVDSPDKAVSRIPIIEVRMFSTDGEGHLVPKSRAKKLRIIEMGPDHRVLRSTVLVPNP